MESKRAFVQRLFTTIAPRYDWFNRLGSLGLDQRWRRRAVGESGLSGGMQVLDVCTGTGDLAVLCARRLRGRGAVVGVDFNETMLRGATHKQRPGEPAIGWLRGDAQALPFGQERFDRVVIGFSTRNLSDLTQGLGEMVRVLKPRGRLMILETGRPSNRLVRMGYLAFLGTVARVIGFALTGRVWPFTYLARSVKGFLSPEEMVALLNACGTQARYVPLSWGLASLYVADKISA
ncbi:MAG: ubiquinone/menaquinone biosynthesis methyltransferase [Candidatus Omnitrophica bacterium]|nr:ubiquinone/menaquinone biosynthesis methyltransferase [Candidatus Omnitrophota bacterium]